MKIITLEEHMSTSNAQKVLNDYMMVNPDLTSEEGKILGQSFASGLIAYQFAPEVVTDVSALRLKYMDDNGIDMQVLSYGDANASLVPLPAEVNLNLTQGINEAIYQAVVQHPDRFAGFATLPMADPKAAASELERAVKELGMKGAMLLGTVNGEFLDAPKYRPVFEKAAELGVPLSLHPSIPAKSVRSAYYSDMDPMGLNALFSGPGWGWHQEAGWQMIRLILSGLFDELPDLNMITGHWGEFVPFWLERLDEATDPVIKKAKTLKRAVSDYYRDNVYVTPSGMFTWPQFQLVLTEMGADHILWAQDYPYVSGPEVRTFLENAPIAPNDREKIANGNARKLLRL